MREKASFRQRNRQKHTFFEDFRAKDWLERLFCVTLQAENFVYLIHEYEQDIKVSLNRFGRCAGGVW